MSDIRGLDEHGHPHDVSVSNKGDIYVTSRAFRTPYKRVPGLSIAGAYAAADAFGTTMEFVVPREGTIASVIFLDHDDEGIVKELVLFDKIFTETADNAAFTVSDVDMRYCVGVVSIDVFFNFAANQVGQGSPALAYVAPQSRLWGQLVTRGADNIAADNEPELLLVIV